MFSQWAIPPCRPNLCLRTHVDLASISLSALARQFVRAFGLLLNGPFRIVQRVLN